MNKQRALRHLNRHYSRENTIARDMIASIAFGFIIAPICVTGIILVMGNAERIESAFFDFFSWVVLKFTI